MWNKGTSKRGAQDMKATKVKRGYWTLESEKAPVYAAIAYCTEYDVNDVWGTGWLLAFRDKTTGVIVKRGTRYSTCEAAMTAAREEVQS
jgi:hypothetical protein